MYLDTYERIAIACIVFYSFALIGGIALCFKHGAHKSAGWRFLIILALARLIGQSMLLGTIDDPTNESLYIGWNTLNGLGLGPLVVMLLGLLGRVFEGITAVRHGNFIWRPQFTRLVELLMLVGFILIIVGGTQIDYEVQPSSAEVPAVQYSGLTVAGVAIFTAVTVILCIATSIVFFHWHDIPDGEHRIAVAVLISLPFVIVRLIYSCIEVYGDVVPSRWMYLGMFIIMEMIVVLICEALGFSLGKADERDMPPLPGQTDPEQADQEKQGGGLWFPGKRLLARRERRRGNLF
ncbi:hypothetical protein RJ55_06905 [Drechmeria coniospora]|nr:hypothetical protein RJ55_06905 [Drechmeria coniospora]